MTIALDLLRRYWKPAAVLILLLIAYLKGAADKDAAWEVKWAERDGREAVAAVNRVNAARKQEADWSAAFDVINTIQQESLTDAISRRDRIIAGLRSGRLSFRPACGGVPEATAHPGEPEAAPDAGQSGLVGEAITARLAVCDEVTLERNQAVRLLEAERQ